MGFRGRATRNEMNYMSEGISGESKLIFIILSAAMLILCIFTPLNIYGEDKTGKAQINKIELTQQEEAFIDSSKGIRVVFTEAWEPLEMTDSKTGEFSGVVFDIMETISQISGLKFEYLKADSNEAAAELIERGDADVIATFNYDAETAEKLNVKLTDAYLELPLVLVNSKNTDTGSRTAVPTHYYAFKTIEHTGKYDFVFYNDVAECIDSVYSGKADQAIVNSYSANSLLSQNKYKSLRTTALLESNFDLCMGVGQNLDPLLISTLNKSISSITISQMNGMIIKNTVDTQDVNISNFISRIPVLVMMAALGVLLLAIIILCSLLRNRIRSNRKIQNLLYTDQVTGIFNAQGFEKRVLEVLKKPRQQNYTVIVDFDINAFEKHNALYGFAAGNKLLCDIAEITRRACRSDETCARIADDHFVWLISGSGCEEIKERICNINGEFQGLVLDSSLLLSYGIFRVTDTSLSVSIMRDKAMAAKRTVKGNYERYIALYDEGLHRQEIEDAELIGDMEAALERDEFVAYYQPKYDVGSEQIVGAEALVRWIRPEGRINPDRFIQLFEKSGLISRLDLYIFEKVCEKLAELKRQGIKPVPVSVNFSRVHLYDTGFADRLNFIAEGFGIDTSMLEIEFTESAFLENGKDMLMGTERLHQLGFLVAIDDFGSGFSSLNILKDISFDVIKIDREFLSSVDENEKAKIVIKNVLGLARELKLKTVAEGVETIEQLEFLRKNGCDIVQGYYFSKPLPEEEFDKLLKRKYKD